jgi:hypothetical protein
MTLDDAAWRSEATTRVLRLALREAFQLGNATIAQKFERFHADNPRVYETLLHLSREWLRRMGGRKCGIGALFERARWELAMETNTPDYKLNNNFRAFYARLLMLKNPELRGMFDLRVSEADEWLQRVAS